MLVLQYCYFVFMSSLYLENKGIFNVFLNVLHFSMLALS